MALVVIKDIQAHNKSALEIDFDVTVSISFSDADLDTDPFNLKVQVEIGGSIVTVIASRWEVKWRTLDVGIVQFNFQSKIDGRYYSPDINELSPYYDPHIGGDLARRYRATAAAMSFIEQVFGGGEGEFPRRVHEVMITPADGRERDIQVKIPVVIVNYRRPLPDCDFRDYVDLIALDNIDWMVKATLESATTRSSDSTRFYRSVQLYEHGIPVDDPVDEE